MFKPLEAAGYATHGNIPSIIANTIPNPTFSAPPLSASLEPTQFLSWSPSRFQSTFPSALSTTSVTTFSGHDAPASTIHAQAVASARHGLLHFDFSAPAHWSDGAILVGAIVAYEVIKRFIFRGTLDSLFFKTAPEISLDQLPHLTKEERVFLQQYTAMPPRAAIIAGTWNSVTHERRLESMLQHFITTNPALSDDFFEATVRIAERYVDRHPRRNEHRTDPLVDCAFQQISKLVETPNIVTDPRFCKTLERMAEVSWNPALSFSPFIEGPYGKEQLKPGFDERFAQAVESWCLYRDLWNGDFGRQLFIQAAHAIALLAKTNPEQTLKARVLLLRECWRNQDAETFVRDRIFKSFENDPLRAQLPAFAKSFKRDGRFREIVQEILDKFPLETPTSSANAKQDISRATPSKTNGGASISNRLLS